MMAVQFEPAKIGAMQYGGVTIGEAMIDGQVVYRSGPPVVTITGTAGYQSRDQFRAACTQYGVDYQTVQELPFLLDTSQATNLTSLFYNCSSLTTVPNLDTSQATTLTWMFYGCSALTTVPNLDTSQATNLASLFCNCSSLTTVPNLDTSQATNLTWMFGHCSSLTSVPDLDISQATNTGSMFYGCSALTTAPNLNTSKATDVSFMFRDCSSLTTAPNLNTSQATNLASLFEDCSSLTSVPDLDTSKATNLTWMFYNCSSLTDGNVRCIGKHPSVNTASMIAGASLTREPFLGAEGTITGRTLTNNVLTTLATRTITAAEGSNLKLLQMTLAWGNATDTKSIRIDRNGVQVATATGQNPIATTELVCNVGDVITYKATVNSTTTANRVINSGTWGAWTR